MPIAIGSAAPDFSLYDQDRNEVTLESLKGRKTLVVFIPFPFTGNCQDELCTIRDRHAELNDLDANVVAITTNPLFSNKAWADQNGLDFPVLSDFWPHGAITDAYGTFDPKVGAANRSTYVLDEAGVVRAIVATESRSVIREFDEYVAALESF
jgi:peroxiredoxin (alkyl hydroperoxide reductase subunit C)